jgi:dienelactone hydrolase
MEDRMMLRAAIALAMVAALAVGGAAQAAIVNIDTARHRPAQIALHWLPSEAAGPRPAVIALHGCGGLRAAQGGGLAERYREYARLFHAAGWHVALPDSFGGRSLCAVSNDERDVKIDDRRADVLATLAWLQSRSDVDPARIAIVGWSHGATTALSATNAMRTVSAKGVAGVAAFYPSCSSLVKWPFAVSSPVLMQVGEKDDWTPAAHCQQLHDVVTKSGATLPFRVVVHADSHHGFDGTRPVRFRPDVANGKGAHSGGNPTARAASMAELMNFLRQVLG